MPSLREEVDGLPITDMSPLLPLINSKEYLIDARHTQSEIASDLWICSTHVFPAAYPRTRVGSAVVPACKREARPTKEEVMHQSFELWKRQMQSSVNDTRVDEPPLFISCKRYRPRKCRSNPRKLTLILAHANGLHKETYEPFIHHLLKTCSQSDQYSIEEIWSIDQVNQGQSGRINFDKLGLIFDWNDVGRDIAQFIINYLPEAPAGDHPPFQLCPQPLTADEREFQNTKSSFTSRSFPTWRNRSICLLGHSIGGVGMVTAAALCKDLISNLVCIDPVIANGVTYFTHRVPGALSRRDEWQTRAEALQSFRSKKDFFGKWHPKVLELYVEEGLYQDSDRSFRLKCERYQEAVSFADPHMQGSRSAYNRLTQLSPTLKVHFILADPKQSMIDFTGMTPDLLLNQCKQCKPSYSRLNGGHLLVQEMPLDLADEVHGLLSRWTAEDGTSRSCKL